MNKIIWVERNNPDGLLKIQLPNQYKGFEGELKDIYYVKNNDLDLRAFMSYFSKFPKWMIT